MKKNIAEQIIRDCNEIEEEMRLASKSKRTILEDMELILMALQDCQFSLEFLETSNEYTRQICKMYNLTHEEAIFFTLLIEENDSTGVNLDCLARLLSCKKVRILRYTNVIEQLCRKRLLRQIESRKGQVAYKVLNDVIKAVRKNQVYTPKNIKDLTITHFFYILDEIFTDNEDSDCTKESLQFDLNELVSENPKLDFVKQLKALKLKAEELIVFLFFCHSFINSDDESICIRDICDLIERSEHLRIKNSFQKQKSILFDKKLIELKADDRFGRKDCYQLTEKAKKEFLQEVCSVQKIEKDKKLIDFNSIKAKEMFYNDKEQKQIDTLSNLLQVDEFAKIEEKLSNSSLRTGFACIFYGSPGTGKTETVLQLAKKSGRDIFEVNISEMKSMWFGQSEKIVQELFDQYREMIKQSEIAPILLFNEADAIFSKRKNIDNQNGVAQTENAIQNIILQEMEKLQGILIATTNLAQNLDKAFERRFLYKIRFEQPSAQAKEFIWKSMLKDNPAIVMTDEEYIELASKYNFSGGQIENIARKCQVEHILNEGIISMESINLFCEDELLMQENTLNSIGFKKQ